MGLHPQQHAWALQCASCPAAPRLDFSCDQGLHKSVWYGHRVASPQAIHRCVTWVKFIVGVVRHWFVLSAVVDRCAMPSVKACIPAHMNISGRLRFSCN